MSTSESMSTAGVTTAAGLVAAGGTERSRRPRGRLLASELHLVLARRRNLVLLAILGLFMGVGLMAWFYGQNVLYSSNGVIQAGSGVGNEFIYIIAAVVGGTLLTGGYGSSLGVAIGAFIFGMTNQGIVYAGWNPDWFKFFLGAMLLFAVIANNVFRNYAAKR